MQALQILTPTGPPKLTRNVDIVGPCCNSVSIVTAQSPYPGANFIPISLLHRIPCATIDVLHGGCGHFQKLFHKYRNPCCSQERHAQAPVCFSGKRLKQAADTNCRRGNSYGVTVVQDCLCTTVCRRRGPQAFMLSMRGRRSEDVHAQCDLDISAVCDGT